MPSGQHHRDIRPLAQIRQHGNTRSTIEANVDDLNMAVRPHHVDVDGMVPHVLEKALPQAVVAKKLTPQQPVKKPS